MVELSSQRVPSGRFRVHDLADPLDWLPDNSMDLVLFALALEYVDDRTRALASPGVCCGLTGRWSCRGCIRPVIGCATAATTSMCG